jgi:hypothetical protein
MRGCDVAQESAWALGQGLDHQVDENQKYLFFFVV